MNFSVGCRSNSHGIALQVYCVNCEKNTLAAAFINLLSVGFSDVHMYMTQPAVYGPNQGNMAPADVSYQNPPCGPAGMGQTPNYSAPTTQSLPAPSEGQQAPYTAEKALL